MRMYIYTISLTLLVFLFIFLLFIILGMCGQYFAQTPVSSSLDAFELGNTDADELSDVRNQIILIYRSYGYKSHMI